MHVNQILVRHCILEKVTLAIMNVFQAVILLHINFRIVPLEKLMKLTADLIVPQMDLNIMIQEIKFVLIIVMVIHMQQKIRMILLHAAIPVLSLFFLKMIIVLKYVQKNVMKILKMEKQITLEKQVILEIGNVLTIVRQLHINLEMIKMLKIKHIADNDVPIMFNIIKMRISFV